MLRTLSTLAASTLIVGGLTAQAQQPTSMPVQPKVTSQPATYSFANGFQLSTGTTGIMPRTGPETIWDNDDGDEVYFGRFFNAVTEEGIDEAAFERLSGGTYINGDRQINGINFQYCSDLPDPLQTLDVLATDLRFYRDYFSGGSPTLWPAAECEYSMQLAGADALGALACYVVMMDFTGGLECSVPFEATPGAAGLPGGVGHFGIGWQMADPNPYQTVPGVPPNGYTGLILDNIGLGSAPGYGHIDLYENHDRTPLAEVRLGSFWFGGAVDAQATFVCELLGLPVDTFAYNSAGGAGAEDNLELFTLQEMRPGQPIEFNVADHDGVADNYALIIATGPNDFPNPFAPGANILIDHLNILITVPMSAATVNGLPGGTFGPIVVPPTLTNDVYIQAAEYVGALNPANSTGMSNGLHGDII